MSSDLQSRVWPSKSHSFYQFTVNLNLFLIQDYANDDDHNNDNLHALNHTKPLMLNLRWSTFFSASRPCTNVCFCVVHFAFPIICFNASWQWNSLWYLLFHHNKIQPTSQQQLYILSCADNLLDMAWKMEKRSCEREKARNIYIR